MSIPSLLGPIDTNASFMLASIQNGQPYILNGLPGDQGITYYWESNIQTINNGTNMGIFTVKGSLSSLTLSDTINGGGIGFTGNNIIINVSNPINIAMSQPSYANWWPPDIFLSMATYSITDLSGATGNIPVGLTGAPIEANNIIILPIFWYSNCTSSGSYNVINQPLDSVTNWFCNVSPIGCTGTDIINSAWTNISDCTIGYNYTYCPSGENCGNSNCKGPCTSSYDDCNYRAGNFVCVFDPAKFISEDQWWTNPIFIGAIVGLVALILIFIFVTIAVSRYGKVVEKPPSGFESYYISG